MKKMILSSIAFLLMIQMYAQSDLTVTIIGIDSNNGDVYIALYDSEEHFLNKNFKGAKVKIENHMATTTFKDIPMGTYAISSYHDENVNNEMDSGLFGIPLEDYGFSNNAKGSFGPPKWKDAKFVIEQNKASHSIKF